MATHADKETNGCTFWWEVENVSHCWLRMGKLISSPTFVANALSNSTWLLELDPRGNSDGSLVSVHLIRKLYCERPNAVEVNYQLALLDKDFSSSKIICESTACFDENRTIAILTESRERLFVTERERFLPADTLTVQCTIWKKGETLVKPMFFSARTVFRVDRRSFIWKIDDFSSLRPGMEANYKNSSMDIELVFKDGLDSERKLVLNGKCLNENLQYFSFQIFVIDSEGKKEDCGTNEYFKADLQSSIMLTLLETKRFMENKSRYLTNDHLILACEYLSSDGTYVHELACDGMIFPNSTSAFIEKNEHFTEENKPHPTTTLAIDMKAMYEDGNFCDTEIRTPTHTFPVHKLILSARSAVFRRMFSNDMKEKNSGQVDITDLDDDTVRRMILYIYADSLEDLQLENAIKLYEAADKYEISSLRNRCSSFLKENLCLNKACDVLLLADLHHDDLKSVVQEYMVKNEEVFRSEEWKHIMATNPKLALDTLYRKFLPG